MNIKKLAILSILLISLSGCQTKEPEKIPRTPKELKVIKTYVIGQDQPKLNLKLSATVESQSSAYVISEISGRVTEIKAKIGQEVKKGETLITLGDSLSTNLLSLNYQTAQSNQQIAEKSLYLTEQNAFKTAETTKLQAYTSYENYKNTLNKIDATQKFHENQYEISSIDLDTLNKTYKTSKQAYSDALDNLEDAEEAYDDYQDSDIDNDQLENQLKTNIKLAESQIDNAKLAMQTSKNRVEQAEIGIENLEDNYDSQLQELYFALQTAYNQFIGAVSQNESAEIGSELQQLQAQIQLLQAQSNLKNVSLNNSGKTVKAPIEGKITQITIQNGNIVNPGQNLVKIENSKILKVKTAINAKELPFLRTNMAVTIELSGQHLQGIITSINNVANEVSKKFEIEIIVNNQKEIALESFATVYINPQIFDEIFIPLKTVTVSENNAYIYVIDNENKIQIRNIQTGITIASYIEVASGLKPGDKIAVAGTQTLTAGEEVKPKAKPIKRKP